MITERELDILELLVREYIRTAEPVSSERIASKMRHGLSSASVRNIFTDLTDAGYIIQPHTSGGRVPRSRGYRFFVERILERENPPPMAERLASGAHTLLEFQTLLAEQFHVLSAVSNMAPVGFREVLGEPEFTDHKRVEELGTVLDGLDEYQDAYGSRVRESPFEIIIGEENEIHPIFDMTIMVTRTPDQQTLCITGPTRMQYDRIIHVLHIWQTKKNKK